MYFNLEVHPIFYLNFIKQLTVDPSGPAIDLHVPVHVIIGTTPLRSVVQQYQTQFGMSTPETPALPSPGAAPNPSVAPTDKLNLRECICNFTSIHNDTFVYYLHCRSTDAVWAWRRLCFKHSWLACYYFMFFTY